MAGNDEGVLRTASVVAVTPIAGLAWFEVAASPMSSKLHISGFPKDGLGLYSRVSHRITGLAVAVREEGGTLVSDQALSW